MCVAYLLIFGFSCIGANEVSEFFSPPLDGRRDVESNFYVVKFSNNWGDSAEYTINITRMDYTITANNTVGFPWPLYVNSLICIISCSGHINQYGISLGFLPFISFAVIQKNNANDSPTFDIQDCSQQISPKDNVIFTIEDIFDWVNLVHACICGGKTNFSCNPARKASDVCGQPPTKIPGDEYTLCLDAPLSHLTARLYFTSIVGGFYYTVIVTSEAGAQIDPPQTHSLMVDGKNCTTTCNGFIESSGDLHFGLQLASYEYNILEVRETSTGSINSVSYVQFQLMPSLSTQFETILFCTNGAFCAQDTGEFVYMIQLCPAISNVTDCSSRDYHGKCVPPSTSQPVTTFGSTKPTSLLTTHHGHTHKTKAYSTTNRITTAPTSPSTVFTNYVTNTATVPTTARKTATTVDGFTETTKTTGTTGTATGSTVQTSSSSTPFISTTQAISPTYLPSLKNISDIPITKDNIGTILNMTLTYSDKPQLLDANDLIYIANILENCSKIEGITKEVSALFMTNVDYVLAINLNVFQDDVSINDNAAGRILNTMPLLVVNADHDLNYTKGKNVGCISRKMNCTKNGQQSVGMMDTGSTFIADTHTDSASSSYKAGIEMPADFLCNSDATHAMVTILRDRKLFVGRTKYHTVKQQRKPIAAMQMFGREDVPSTTTTPLERIGNAPEDPPKCEKQQYLQDEGRAYTATAIDGSDKKNIRLISRMEDEKGVLAKIRIDVSKFLPPLHGKYKVTWWDTENLEWSNERACEILKQKDGMIHAECNHLTDFTLLIDGMPRDPCVCDQPLVIIGYLMNGASLICLLFMLIIAVIGRSLRLRRLPLAQKILGNQLTRRNTITLVYNTTLFAFYFVFTIFSDGDISKGACDVFAGISYILFMSCILLTIFQALRTVRLFYADSDNMGRLLAFSSHLSVVTTISFGLPLVMTILLYTLTNFFVRQDNYCWVRNDYITYAIVIPLSLLLGNAVICSLLVLRKLFYAGSSSSRVILTKDHIRQRIVTIMLMQLTLGMPWVLQYFAIFSPTTTAWHYLFTIVNGSQGVTIFALWLYRRWRHTVTGRRAKTQRALTIQTNMSSDGEESE